jgi:hypothetical protein
MKLLLVMKIKEPSLGKGTTRKMTYKTIFLKILYAHLCKMQAVSTHSLMEDIQQDTQKDTLVEEVESLVGVGEEKCHRRHHHPQHLSAELSSPVAIITP